MTQRDSTDLTQGRAFKLGEAPEYPTGRSLISTMVLRWSKFAAECWLVHVQPTVGVSAFTDTVRVVCGAGSMKRSSVRLSHQSTAAAVTGGFAAKRPAGYRSTAAGAASAAGALSSNGAATRRSAANAGSATLIAEVQG